MKTSDRRSITIKMKAISMQSQYQFFAINSLALILISFVITSNCYASEYHNKSLKITLSVPDGTQIVEGNQLKPMDKVEEEAFKMVFDEEAKDIEQQLNQTIFTLGYYSGPIENGADGSITASAYPSDPNIQNYAKEFAATLIQSEEKETELMSFAFSEKLNEVKISGHNFFVSKGNLKILQDGKTIFEMPIYYYITELNNLTVLFSVSGALEKVKTLEESLLKMEIH